MIHEQIGQLIAGQKLLAQLENAAISNVEKLRKSSDAITAAEANVLSAALELLVVAAGKAVSGVIEAARVALEFESAGIIREPDLRYCLAGLKVIDENYLQSLRRTRDVLLDCPREEIKSLWTPEIERKLEFLADDLDDVMETIALGLDHEFRREVSDAFGEFLKQRGE